MIAEAAILLILAGSLADGIAWALIRRRRNAWPPRRTGVSVATLQETF